jgi:hypothetical protein
VANGTTWLGILPIHLFAHGRAFFVEGIADVPGAPTPFVAHANFMYDSDAKRHRFREHLLWHVRRCRLSFLPFLSSVRLPLHVSSNRHDSDATRQDARKRLLSNGRRPCGRHCSTRDICLSWYLKSACRSTAFPVCLAASAPFYRHVASVCPPFCRYVTCCSTPSLEATCQQVHLFHILCVASVCPPLPYPMRCGV